MFKPQLAFPNLHPVCPIDLLPEPLRGAVLYAITKMGTPPAVALTDGLAAAGAVVHCGFDCVTPDGDSLPATLNTCVVAPSATGKGRSIKLFFRHFLNSHKQRKPRSIERNGRGDPLTPARKPLVEAMVNNISVRRLIQELDGVGMNLTIQREEGASFLTTDLFKHGTDALTQVWSGDPPLDHFVMGAELVAVDARVSLGFRIQPDLMYDYLRHSGRLSYKLGFWPRAIAGCHDPERFPENERYRPNFFRSGTARPFHDRVEELAASINSLREPGGVDRIGMELGVEATAFMLELGLRMKSWTPNYYQDIREAAGRAWENTLRIAVVLHVFCVGAGKVSLDMVECAWAIAEWSLSQHRLIFIEAISHAPGQEVLATSAYAMQPKAPKPAKLPRPLQDAQWVLTCLDRMCTPFVRQAMLSDVRLLGGLPEKRLMTALAWLKQEGIVETPMVDESMLIRRRIQWI